MRTRQTARLVLLDDKDRLLLFNFEDNAIRDPGAPAGNRTFWVTPGGRIEDGESHEDTLKRELLEETGISAQEANIGKLIWVGEQVLQWDGELIRAHDSFYYARTKRTEICRDQMTELEQKCYRGHRWWTLPQLRESNELIFPPQLALLLEPILRGDFPEEAIRL